MLTDPITGRYLPTDPIERFWSKVDKSGDCWLWTAGLNSAGYGKFGPRHGTAVAAHRFAYELVKGRIPEGLYLDHLCRVHNCVNPAHLEAVTPRINVLRGDTIASRSAAKTHCPKGHPYDLLNTYYEPKGARRCRECLRAKERRRYWRKHKRS